MARSSRAFDGARDALRRASALAAGGGGDARDGGGARGADASARRAVVEALDAHHALSAQAEWAMGDDVRAYAEATGRSAAAARGARRRTRRWRTSGDRAARERSWRGLVGWR